MTPDLRALFWICCLVVIVYLFVSVTRNVLHLRRLATLKMEPERRCGCGYILNNLKMPRCPECGRAIGFDKSFAELGIDEKEVRQHVEPRQSLRKHP